jgi:hypothetical protein
MVMIMMMMMMMIFGEMWEEGLVKVVDVREFPNSP